MAGSVITETDTLGEERHRLNNGSRMTCKESSKNILRCNRTTAAANSSNNNPQNTPVFHPSSSSNKKSGIFGGSKQKESEEKYPLTSTNWKMVDAEGSHNELTMCSSALH